MAPRAASRPLPDHPFKLPTLALAHAGHILRHRLAVQHAPQAVHRPGRQRHAAHAVILKHALGDGHPIGVHLEDCCGNQAGSILSIGAEPGVHPLSSPPPGPKENAPGERFPGRLPEGASRRARGVTLALKPGSGRARPPGGRIAPARGGGRARPSEQCPDLTAVKSGEVNQSSFVLRVPLPVSGRLSLSPLTLPSVWPIGRRISSWLRETELSCLPLPLDFELYFFSVT